MKILFICKSHAGRSQMATAFFNKLSKKHFAFGAGTLVGKSEGTKIPALVIASMAEERFDLSHKTRNQLTPEMVNQADKIIITDEKENLPDYLIHSSKNVFWNVPDAVGTSLEFHNQIRDQLKELVKNLIKELD